MVSVDTLRDYNASRPPTTDRSVLCHAPFVSLNFDQSGRVTSCCYNRSFVLGTYPEQTVGEIWSGAAAEELRDAFRHNTTARGCDLCFEQLKGRNFAGVLMRSYDLLAQPGDRDGMDLPIVPKMLEFEISNNCSLECVMCSGHWSSAIRARREKLPPLRNPYDRAFVEQIEAFLPGIVRARFLGGEPFLINRYYEIWESIRRLNPDAVLSITTSGAVLPDKAKTLLEALRADIVVSIDSIVRPTYEFIRLNANFDEVMRNVEYLIDYTRRRGTRLSFAVCPMTYNWRELRGIVEFCEARGLEVYFNTVTRPVEATLGSLSEADLAEAVSVLGSAPSETWLPQNRSQWHGMLNQLRSWLQEKRAFAERCRAMAARAGALLTAGSGDDDAARSAVLDHLVLSCRVEQERSMNADLTCWLPQQPLPLWPEHEHTPDGEILLAAHAVGIALDEQRGAPPLDVPHIVDEQRRLQRFIEALMTHDSAVDGRQQLGAWIRKALQSGDVRGVFEMTKTMVRQGDEASVLSSLTAEGLEARLAAAWTTLGLGTASERARERMTGYLRWIIDSQLPAALLGLSRPAESSATAGPIRGLDDLGHALTAIQVFHLWSRPEGDHGDLFARIGRVRDAVARAGESAATQLPADLHIRNISMFLTTTTDDQFADALKALG